MRRERTRLMVKPAYAGSSSSRAETANDPRLNEVKFVPERASKALRRLVLVGWRWKSRVWRKDDDAGATVVTWSVGE